MSLDYGIFDCDTHCYEHLDAFTRYLPKEMMTRASIFPVRDPSGDLVVLAGGRVANFNSEQHGLGLETSFRPGSLKEMLRTMSSGNPDEAYLPLPMEPEYTEREPRLASLAAQGVESCIMFPGSLALSAEGYVRDTEALYANITSFNRWYDETWGFNYQDKIYATALLSLRDLDLAVAETDRVLARGARVVLLPTGPAYGRSPGDPYFDPVWSRLAEAGVVVAFHIMPNWYHEAISPAWGLDPDTMAWRMSAWGWQNIYGDRPIMDTISALIFDNLFGRFPSLKVVAAEHGAEWIPHFVKRLDKSRGMGRNGPWIGGKLTERPSRIFQHHVRVTPYPEDNTPWIVEQLGTDECLVMGSDYPHAEGAAQPVDFLDGLTALDAASQRRIMRDNAHSMFAFA